MKGPSVKIRPLYLSAGLLVLFMLSLYGPLQADTNSVSGTNSVGAHIDFIIRIPQVLSLKIGIPHEADRSLSQDFDVTGPPATPQGTSKIYVSASGTLSPGGVLALTATGSDPLSFKQGYPVIRAGITWTASRTSWTGGAPMEPSYLISANHSSPSSFTFHRYHRRQTSDTNEPVFYVISAP